MIRIKTILLQNFLQLFQTFFLSIDQPKFRHFLSLSIFIHSFIEILLKRFNNNKRQKRKKLKKLLFDFLNKRLESLLTKNASNSCLLLSFKVLHDVNLVTYLRRFFVFTIIKIIREDQTWKYILKQKRFFCSISLIYIEFDT